MKKLLFSLLLLIVGTVGASKPPPERPRKENRGVGLFVKTLTGGTLFLDDALVQTGTTTWNDFIEECEQRMDDDTYQFYYDGGGVEIVLAGRIRGTRTSGLITEEQRREFMRNNCSHAVCFVPAEEDQDQADEQDQEEPEADQVEQTGWTARQIATITAAAGVVAGILFKLFNK